MSVEVWTLGGCWTERQSTQCPLLPTCWFRFPCLLPLALLPPSVPLPLTAVLPYMAGVLAARPSPPPPPLPSQLHSPTWPGSWPLDQALPLPPFPHSCTPLHGRGSGRSTRVLQQCRGGHRMVRARGHVP